MTTTDTQQTTKWTLDKNHSQVEFSAKHMMFTTVRGRFNSVEAEVDWNEADPTKSSVVATIDANSLTTFNDQRDTHLRSGDFFEVEKNPTITFRSTRIEAAGKNEFRITGDLTVRGVTKEVALATTYEGRGVDPYGNVHAAFAAHTTINRKDWGLTWNVALETGGVLVGDTIKIDIEAELLEQKAA
ncbi:MAG: YceI family protein [Chloroflexia bacterium]